MKQSLLALGILYGLSTNPTSANSPEEKLQDLQARCEESPFYEDYKKRQIIGLENAWSNKGTYEIAACPLTKRSIKYDNNKFKTTSFFTPEVNKELRRIEKRIGTERGNLTLTILIETGGNPNQTSSTGAYGVGQLTKRRMKQCGLTKEGLELLENHARVRAQLGCYFDNVLEELKIEELPDSSLSTLYKSIAGPASIKKSQNSTIYEIGTQAYSGNKQWDLNKDGKITGKELGDFAIMRSQKILNYKSSQ